MILSTPALASLLPVFMILCWTSWTLGINSSLPNLLNHSLGVNCRGSALCPGYLEAFPPDYIGLLIELTNGSSHYCPLDFSCGPLNDTDIYLPKDHIVCLPLGQSFLGGICAFAQGRNVPATGVTGALVKRKLRELRDHGCTVCGSVPLSGDNDPRSQGILTVNYIGGMACKGLCPPKHYSALLQNAANESLLSTSSGLLLES